MDEPTRQICIDKLEHVPRDGGYILLGLCL